MYNRVKRLFPVWLKHGIKTQWKTLRLRGNAVHCPCCQRNFSRFLPGPEHQGGEHRQFCDRCQSRERHRLFMLYVARKTDLLTRPQAVLHFSPNAGIALRLVNQPGLTYFTTNYSHDPTTHLQMDITQLACADNAFDVIICSHVLEHIPDDMAALRELYRVLKPGGWANLNVPLRHGLAETFEDWSVTTPEDRLRVFGQWDHVRNIGTDYADRMRAAGFQMELSVAGNVFTDAEITRFGLNRNETLFIARKPA